MAQAESLLAIGYRYFAAVAQAGSVRAASRHLNVAASAISRQVSLLEAQLGIALFERDGGALALTEAGSALLKGLTAAALTHEGTLDMLAGFKGISRGRVRIATVESLSISLLPQILTGFSQSYPGVQATITVAGSDAITEMVRERAADAGLTFNPTALDGLAVEFAKGIGLGAVMAVSHPLAAEAALTLADCLAYPVAWPARELSIRAVLDRAVGARASPAGRVFECNSLRLMSALARDSGCISFQTRFGIERDIEDGLLAFIPLSDRNLPPNRLTLVRRPGLDRSTAAGAFADYARRELAKIIDVRK